MPSLPDDVLRRVFDEIELRSLVTASHVSRAWRAAAHGHPTFSREIQFIHHKVIEPTPAAADFLFTRALATSGIINLCIFMSTQSVFAKDVVLPLVSLCLPRVEDLRLVLDPSLAVNLLKVLEHPAPRLKSLRFDVTDSLGPAIWELPSTFLGGSAPLLHTFITRGFTSVPGLRTIPGISTTKKLVYEPPCDPRDGPASVLRAMLGLLPDLEYLYINGDGDWPDKDIWDAHSPSTPMHRLELGTCAASMTTVHFVAALSTADTRHISLTDGISADVFDFMVSSLSGALGLRFARHPSVNDFWNVRLTDADGRERQLDFWESERPEFASDVIPHIPMFAPLAHRIAHVSVDITLWKYIAELCPELPSVETLDLSISRPGSEDRTISQVKWPRLNTIVISSARRAPVNVLWLAKFMGHTLGCVARGKLNLHLKGCQLHGDPELVWGFFDEIRLLRA